ncbi:MAG: cytochrome c peroxidase [Pseudomonadota bacterium]
MRISQRRIAAAVLAAALFSPALAVGEAIVCEEPSHAATASPAALLGRDLFFDPILSGNGEVSCATCHHPRHATSDGLSLGIGDGGRGIGPERTVDLANAPERRIPRNSPALFNLGRDAFAVMFHDGRLEASPEGGLRTPIGEDMLNGDLSPLAAQTIFPVLSPDEMAGHAGENPVANAVRRGLITGEGGAWSLLLRDIAAIPAYRARFKAAFGRAPDFIGVAEALAAFIAFEWRADESAFDRRICDGTQLPPDAEAGMVLFYGEAGCADCHSGRWQTDHGFHAIAMPQIGPGKAEVFESHRRDMGRMRVTGRAEDAYRFRTPSLRNIAATGPYGHSGAYATLEAVVRHHLDPVTALRAYDPSQAILPAFSDADDFALMRNPEEVAAISAANELAPRSLSDEEVAQILAFLDALTDEASLKGRLGPPDRTPSGLVMR